MPYIKNLKRAELDPTFIESTMLPTNSGELNFCITRLCDDYINRRGLKYEQINAVIGALECAKLELYRRIAAPYEDRKIKTNGDVYDTTERA